MNTDTSIQNAAVEVNLSTLAISSSGSITGVVTIRVGHSVFPEARWNDFPVVILSWWLEPVSRILAGKSRVWECRFMDGPFSVRLEQQHNDAWTLFGFYDGRVEFTATVSCRGFMVSLFEAAHQIVRECRQRGWQTQDVETLDSVVRNSHDAV